MDDEVRVPVGDGTLVIVTEAEAIAVPPGPEQEITKVEGAVKFPVEAVPEVAFGPDQAPLAVQEVALIEEDQVRLLAVPEVTFVGEAEIETVGALIPTCKSTVTEPAWTTVVPKIKTERINKNSFVFFIIIIREPFS